MGQGGEYAAIAPPEPSCRRVPAPYVVEMPRGGLVDSAESGSTTAVQGGKRAEKHSIEKTACVSEDQRQQLMCPSRSGPTERNHWTRNRWSLGGRPVRPAWRPTRWTDLPKSRFWVDVTSSSPRVTPGEAAARARVRGDNWLPSGQPTGCATRLADSSDSRLKPGHATREHWLTTKGDCAHLCPRGDTS